MTEVSRVTVNELAQVQGFKAVTLPDGDRQINGVYIGDLLSWVMGNAEQGNVWITIMTNINTVAVATLVDVSCIILAEDTLPDENVLEVALEKGVNILSTPLSAYKAAVLLSSVLN